MADLASEKKVERSGLLLGGWGGLTTKDNKNTELRNHPQVKTERLE